VPTGPVDDAVVTTVSVTPDAVALSAIGDTVRLQVEVLDQFGTPIDTVVDWISSDGAVISVSSEGLVTALANGTAMIEVVAGDVMESVLITVSQVAASIVVIPDPIVLNGSGDTLQMVATVLDAGGSTISGAAVTWSSDDPGVATVDDGLLTAVTTGETSVMASSEGLSTTVAVTVTPLPASIEVAPDFVDFASLGDATAVVATVRDGGGVVIEGAGVQWLSSDSNVVTVTDGIFVAIGNGTATVVATAGPVAASVVVVVEQVPAAMQIEPNPVTLNGPGDTLTASGSVLDAGGSVIVGELVTWISSAEGIATVSPSGLVTGVAPGEAVLTAQSGPLMSEVTVTVTQTPASIELSVDSVSFSAIGDTSTVVATVRDSGGNPIVDATVTWVSSDPTVADVTGGLITATGFGTATVTASSGAQTTMLVVVVTEPAEAPSFSAVVNEIFVRRGCAANSCHGRGAGDLTLSTNSATSYAELVDVQATAEPTLIRVLPGDADNSYLVIKLEGRQSSGGRMPIGGAPLGAADLANIKNWINAGAPNN